MPFSVLERPFRWKHLLASDQVSAVPGTLHTITINRPDAHAACMITVYDSIGAGDAAHMIANVVLDSALFVIPTTLIYDVEYEHGLYVEFDAGATTADITVSYE